MQNSVFGVGKFGLFEHCLGKEKSTSDLVAVEMERWCWELFLEPLGH